MGWGSVNGCMVALLHRCKVSRGDGQRSGLLMVRFELSYYSVFFIKVSSSLTGAAGRGSVRAEERGERGGAARTKRNCLAPVSLCPFCHSYPLATRKRKQLATCQEIGPNLPEMCENEAEEAECSYLSCGLNRFRKRCPWSLSQQIRQGTRNM